jgi:hypothetical protein
MKKMKILKILIALLLLRDKAVNQLRIDINKISEWVSIKRIVKKIMFHWKIKIIKVGMKVMVLYLIIKKVLGRKFLRVLLLVRKLW